jgi:ribosome-associated protein
MKIEVSREILFRTARSGGSGGQNVNKVETMVEGYFHVAGSGLFNEEEKKTISIKLEKRINAEGFLQVRSQVHRSQLENKQEVVKKMNALLEKALKKEKKRLPTKPTRSSKEKRIGLKKKAGELKENRRKIREIE